LADERPKMFGIITKPDEPRAAELAARIAEWASARDLSLCIDDRVPHPLSDDAFAPACDIADRADLLIVLGGDGTMIAAARLVAGRGTPVLGVNLGTLGYLTEFTVEEALSALEDAARGDYSIERRVMLDWRAMRDGEQIEAGSVLNDVVINKSAMARIIDIDCAAGNQPITTYRADGLIVSTPTGSTAYNLAAGGPIIIPGAEAIAICPICPHTLTNRPLILPDTARVKIRLNTREQEVMLTSDGQKGLQLMAGDSIEISKSAKTFNTICARDRDYFQILRTKLRWSGR
jgi:NAD+ kinase